MGSASGTQNYGWLAQHVMTGSGGPKPKRMASGAEIVASPTQCQTHGGHSRPALMATPRMAPVPGEAPEEEEEEEEEQEEQRRRDESGSSSSSSIRAEAFEGETTATASAAAATVNP